MKTQAQHLIRDQLQILTSRAEELNGDLSAEKLAKYRREILHATKRISMLLGKVGPDCPLEKVCPFFTEGKCST